MKSIGISNHDEHRSLQLAEDQVFSFDAQTLQIECVQGLIWITWPDGNDRVLKTDQTIQVVSKGRICLQAFSTCSVIIRKPQVRNFLRDRFVTADMLT
jgi:hypothetical protein